MTLLSILIINWNGARYLYDCLDSLRAKISIPFETIVVDNNSSDGSPDVVAQRYPWVKLIRSADNLGFAAGNNLAARHATGEYLLLLNNDTVLQTDVADAVAALDADPAIGAVGAAMFGGDGGPRFSSAHFPSPARLWRFASIWFAPGPGDARATPAGPKLYRCDFVEGSFLMTRASAWQQLGGMDERNYMYGDDVEYCRGLLGLGLVTVHCPSVRYTHFGGYTHARMGYLFGGFRRYHRKFSSRAVQMQADLVLHAGLVLRIPWYWARAAVKRDATSRLALRYGLETLRNWSDTLVDGHRFHGS
jgi:GT2 family glycosyltransferase